ncbi:hypothetical protein [Solibacillus sp.]|uniref:hypothetical protein n=1 Tax=Solibacillus sp. TaxID=1909654 RepID=UPI003315E5F5
MLKELYERILQSARPETVEINNKVYSTDRLSLVSENPSVEAIQIHSLSGVVDYIQSHFDGTRNLLIHIQSPTEIYLMDALDSTNNRRIYLKSTALLPTIQFDRFIDREQFQIMLQANFVPTPDHVAVLDIVSHIHIQDGNIELKDNGFTQAVTVKAGAASLSQTPIPPKVSLKPFRTFVEVPQPASDYILRLNERGHVALYEADGGSWQLEAIENIAEYFRAQLLEELQVGSIHVLR